MNFLFIVGEKVSWMVNVVVFWKIKNRSGGGGLVGKIFVV